MFFRNILEVAFEVGDRKGPDGSILGGFSCEFDKIFVLLMLEGCVFDWGFDESDLGMGEVVLVVVVFGLSFFIFVIERNQFGRYFSHIFAAYIIIIKFQYSSIRTIGVRTTKCLETLKLIE